MKNRHAFLIPCGAVFCCMLWGLLFPLMGMLYDAFCSGRPGVGDTLLMAGIRFTGAGLLLLMLAAARGRRPLRTIRQGGLFPKVAVLGLTQTGVQYALYYAAMQWLSGDRGALVSTTNAFFSVLLAHFFCKGDRLNARKILGCVLGVAGIVFLLGGNAPARGWATG